MSLRIALVAEGDANTRDCWSGCAQGFVLALRRAGVTVDVFNAELASWSRWLVAALTFHPDRQRWRQRFNLGATAFAAKSRLASRGIASAASRYDAIVQVGATFSIDRARRRGAPLIVFADANIQFALRGRPFSGASRLDPTEAEKVRDREQRVYDGADRIWVWSELLNHSFQQDFAQPPAKVLTVFAGANTEPGPEPPARDVAAAAPSVLFVGKDLERKGIEVLLQAFRSVRETIPAAELHVVGGRLPSLNQPGVVAHGFLSRGTPEGRTRLADLYQRATVFCLPSRYEPFGVVFVEAMLAGLACIGTRAWAMPEIIADGETGWLVPDGDAAALNRTLLAALGDPARAAEMGRAGRRRALEFFTWDRVASRAIADLTTTSRGQPGPAGA